MTRFRRTSSLRTNWSAYLENPNILYALAPSHVEIGTLRETFAIGCLSESHNVEYGTTASKREQSQAGLSFAEREQARPKVKAQGDFKVDSKYTFEIGGRSKDFSQIAGVEDSYIFADD